ncbi:MAG: hypothetical protein SNF33_01080 [Candidatus Algichlamydia australiensis]|nr:hypothetical protein [Chlamydiales bacterium]
MRDELLELTRDAKAWLLQDLPAKKKPVPAIKLPPPPKPKKQEVPPPPPKPESEPELTLEKPKLEEAKVDSKWGNILGKIAPTVHLHKAPPSDESAKKAKIASRVKAGAPEILLISSPHYAKFHPLLSSIARAIDTRLGSCKLVDVVRLDKQEKWEALLASPTLRLIICPDQLLFSHPKMLSHYQEIPQKKARTLGDKSLLLLPDPSLYIKDPLLKRSLWTVLCKTLSSGS